MWPRGTYLAVRPTQETWQVPHDNQSIQGVVPRLQGLQPTLVVLEAKDGLELPLVAALGVAGLPWRWSILVRCEIWLRPPDAWPKSTVWTRRSGPILLRQCGPQPRPLPDAQSQELVALVACMRKLLTILNSTVKHNRPWDPGLALQNS
jgi:hypothetical protein